MCKLTLACRPTRAPFSGPRQLPGSVGKVRQEFAIRDRRLAILHPAARRLRPLRGRRLGQASELVKLRIDIYEWISVVMRADQKDGGGIVRRKRGDHSECSGKVRYADLGEKIITRNPVVKGCATVCAQRLEELVSTLVATGTGYRRLRRFLRSSSKVSAGRTLPAFI
jgi:hypothetical protein